MKKFLFKILIFGLVIFILDWGIFLLLQQIRPIDYKYFLDSRKDFFSKDREIDILILGDSHIADAIDSKIIEDSCRMSTYNLGMYHAGAYENYHLLKHIVETNQLVPSILILGTDPILLSRPPEPGHYTPLVINDFKDRFRLYSEVDGFDFSYFFKTVKEKYLFLTLFKNLLGIDYVPTRDIKRVYNGYLENHRHDADSKWNNLTDLSDQLDSVQLVYFEKTLELAFKNNIVIVLVNPPVWREALIKTDKSASYAQYADYISAITQKNRLLHFNSDNQVLLDKLEKTDFLNSQHVNYYGAVQFSAELGHFLRVNIDSIKTEMKPLQ